MSRYRGEAESIHTIVRKNTVKKDQAANKVTGVLLTNLGTPAAPTAPALKRYLREFLSDPRVVEIPRLAWLIILHGIILRVRPAKSAKLYQSIWTEQGSPLKVITEAQRDKVAAKIKQQYGDKVIVEYAMRYAEPSIGNALKAFQAKGVSNIVTLPLYPQYAGPTTGSTFDAIFNEVKQWRWVPSIHFLSSYHDNELYIDALANTVLEHIEKHGKPERLVLSYHGMPKLFLERGDPYYCFCAKTTRLLIEKLTTHSDLNSDEIIMSFQSRFGKAEWLKPYTDETLMSLSDQGIKNVAIMSPAFSADCLETLEELAVENRSSFINNGGETYHYIPALNDRDDHINALLNVISPHIHG